MLPSQSVPPNWTPEHSAAFLLLCAAGVDGFERKELETVVPLLGKLGIPQSRALLTAKEAFDHYKLHVQEDTVEDALMAYAVSVKRNLPAGALPHILAAMQEITGVDQKVTEGEWLVLALVKELWEAD